MFSLKPLIKFAGLVWIFFQAYKIFKVSRLTFNQRIFRQKKILLRSPNKSILENSIKFRT